MAEVAIGIDVSGEAGKRKKKRSSRRGDADDEAGERRPRRKKSHQQPGDEAAGGGGDGGERRKKKKRKSQREDETPEEREERRRRRREKKQAKAEAEAAAAAAAAAAIAIAAAAGASDDEDDEDDDDDNRGRTPPPPPPPLPQLVAAAAASDSDSLDEDAVAFGEEPPRRQQPPPPPPPAPKPKPAARPHVPPPPQPPQQPPPPSHWIRVEATPPPPPMTPPRAGGSEDDEDDDDDVDIRASPLPPPPPPAAALGRYSDDEEEDEVPERPRSPTPPQSPTPPPPPSSSVNPADAAALHRYLADTLEDDASDAGGLQQPEPPARRYQQPTHSQQPPPPPTQPQDFDQPDRPPSIAGDRQSLSRQSLSRQSQPAEPPIPEGKKPGGGGLLGRLFASFRRGGSTKRKGSTASAKKASGPAAATAGGASTSSAAGGGLSEQGQWTSNPSLFNPNDTPGNTLEPRLQQQQQPSVALRHPMPGVRPIADTEVRVILLDGEEIGVPIPRKATGGELMARVCEHIDLQETDYFGLTYVDSKERMWFWLDNEKRVMKQLKHCDNRMLNFQVKFYPPEPNMLTADVTRYQLCLQVRQDIYTGKLPCTWVTQALLGSFQVQSELGDYDQAEHGDVGALDYLQNFEFVHNQTPELVAKIAELHRGHKGITPEVADLRYLETARRLEFYGVDLHPARDLDDVDINIGVCFGGVLVYKDRMRISRFAWPKILRISYRKNLFYLKIRSDLYDNVEAVVGFKLMNHRWSKRLWKIAIENHAFFRLKEVQLEKSSSRMSLNFIRGNSSHRYSGRTMHQYRAEGGGGTMRQSGTFDRSLSKRMSASLPSLKGSQYGSFHSLNRLHPRDMRPTGALSGRGGGGGGSVQGVPPARVAGRSGSVSILPTAAFTSSRDRPPSRTPSTANDDLL